MHQSDCTQTVRYNELYCKREAATINVTSCELGCRLCRQPFPRASPPDKAIMAAMAVITQRNSSPASTQLLH